LRSFDKGGRLLLPSGFDIDIIHYRLSTILLINTITITSDQPPRQKSDSIQSDYTHGHHPPQLAPASLAKGQVDPVAYQHTQRDGLDHARSINKNIHWQVTFLRSYTKD
jgi:hypothetical protein